jgi:hypothetical protein
MHRWISRWAAGLAVCASLSVESATAADIPYPANSAPIAAPAAVRIDSFRDRFEFRFGAGAHGVGSVESGSVDLNAELVFPQLLLFGPVAPSWAWVVPRVHLGGMLNLSGRTSYLYTGLLWTYELTNRFFLEGFVGGAVHNGSLNGNPADHLAALGCRALFHVGASAGYRFTPQWSLMFTFAHVSNGNAVLDACGRNQGLNEYLDRVGYSF